jgi:hypothetical protein
MWWNKTDYSCGAAALTTLLRYGFGLDLNEQQVIAGMMAGANPDVVRQQGFSMLDMKHFVNVLGLRASGFVSGAERLPALRIPALIMLDINGYKHFVVLKMATRDTVYVADPALVTVPFPWRTSPGSGMAYCWRWPAGLPAARAVAPVSQPLVSPPADGEHDAGVAGGPGGIRFSLQ